MPNKLLDKIRGWFKKEQPIVSTVDASKFNPYQSNTYGSFVGSAGVYPPFSISGIGTPPVTVRCHECPSNIDINKDEFIEFYYHPSSLPSFDNNICLCKECFSIKGGDTLLSCFRLDAPPFNSDCVFCKKLDGRDIHLRWKLKPAKAFGPLYLILPSCRACFKNKIDYFPGN